MSEHTRPSSAQPTIQGIQPGESVVDWLSQFGQETVDVFKRECRAATRGGRPDVPADVTPPTRRVSNSIEQELAHEIGDETSGKKSLLKEPSMFNGNKEEYEDWRQKVLMYINDVRNNITQGDEKINITLSYMEGKEVRGWIKNLWNNHYDEEIGRWLISWSTFLECLDHQYLDFCLEQKAQQQFSLLEQKSNE
jgi:hypothetical protein